MLTGGKEEKPMEQTAVIENNLNEVEVTKDAIDLAKNEQEIKE